MKNRRKKNLIKHFKNRNSLKVKLSHLKDKERRFEIKRTHVGIISRVEAIQASLGIKSDEIECLSPLPPAGNKNENKRRHRDSKRG